MASFIYHHLLLISVLLAILGLIAGLILSKYKLKRCRRFAFVMMTIGLLLGVAALYPEQTGCLIFFAINLPITGLALAFFGLIAGILLAKYQHKRSMRLAYSIMTIGIILFFLNAIPRTGGSLPPYQFTTDGIATITHIKYSTDKKQLSIKLELMPKHPRQFIYRMYYKSTLPSERLIAKAWLSIQPIRSIISDYYSDMNSTHQLVCPMNKATADAFISQNKWKNNKQIAAIFQVGGCSGCLRTTDLISPSCPN